MPAIVFSKGLHSTWGVELASTLAPEGSEAVFFDLFARMAGCDTAARLVDGDVLSLQGEEFMVLDLEEVETKRLQQARSSLTGAARTDLMICERIADLLDHGILRGADLLHRRGRTIAI